MTSKVIGKQISPLKRRTSPISISITLDRDPSNIIKAFYYADHTSTSESNLSIRLNLLIKPFWIESSLFPAAFCTPKPTAKWRRPNCDSSRFSRTARDGGRTPCEWPDVERCLNTHFWPEQLPTTWCQLNAGPLTCGLNPKSVKDASKKGTPCTSEQLPWHNRHSLWWNS